MAHLVENKEHRNGFIRKCNTQRFCGLRMMFNRRHYYCELILPICPPQTVSMGFAAVMTVR